MRSSGLQRATVELCRAFPMDARFAVRFWDGEEHQFGDVAMPPVFTIHFRSAKALRACFGSLSLGLGEGYMRGDIVVEGSLPELLRGANSPEVRERVEQLSFSAKFRFLLLHLAQRNSIVRSKENIARHYDHGNDFYALWLGERMMYSCAYFRDSSDSLDRAQEQKLEYLCRKLQLQGGERVLDIGCGWGGFAIYAAQRYGVHVTGLTLSQPQLDEGRRRVAAAGLEDRVTLLREDYRTPTAEPFDKVISIGMFEHVGKEHHAAYFAAVDRLLVPGGLAVLHTIGRMCRHVGDPWVHRYIFPGAYIPSLGECVEGITTSGQTITDIENLRIHYAMTLDLWLANFEANLDAVRAQGFDETFIRMWRLYLAGSSATFRYGGLNLWQIVSTKGLRNDLPLSRAHLYQ